MGIDAKYGQIETKKGEIPDDEPVFLIRAQDALAGAIVRYYAILYLSVTNDHQGFNRIIATADEMDVWLPKKLPD